MEPGETEIQTLHREVKEEINCKITKQEPFAEFDTLNHDKTKTLHASCYLAELQGTPQAGEEIQELTWIDKNYKQKGIKLGQLLENYIVPELIRKELL
jgi:8-oxo-dGTP pyrophosphatase MutT (NUDIX family)